MTIDAVLSPELRERMRQDIAQADGHEVLWVATMDANLRVQTLEKVAEGTRDAVAVLRPHCEAGDAIFHNHPSGDTHPSPADLRVAHELGEWGVGFYIVDNAVSQVRMVAKPLVVRPLGALQAQELAQVLAPGGPLSAQEGYEHRPGQVALLEAIVEAFNGDRVLVAEAGTGIGKSFAYLIPAVQWCVTNRERVVISTGTINLQRQILEKDIPRVQQLLGTNLRAELVKGRGNYLCPSRLQEALREADAAQKKALEPFVAWARTTPTGDREDFSGQIPSEIWSEICSEKEICAGYRCGLREECFVTRARRKAAAAHLLVVNHHLLFADLSLRLEGMGWEGNALLPPFRRLILDEAHKIEESATSYFSDSFGRGRLTRSLRRLYRQKKRKKLGVLSALEDEFPAEVTLAQIREVMDQIQAAADRMSLGAQELLGQEGALWIREVDDGVRDRLFRPLQEVCQGLTELAARCQRIWNRLPETVRKQPVGYELQHLIGRLQSLNALGNAILRLENHETTIYWLERTQSDAVINVSPIELGPFLYEALFAPLRTVIATSATLSVRGSFDFFLRNSGADRVVGPRRLCRIFESPFDYARRVLLGIPTDLPSPDQEQAWLTAALRIAAEAIQVSGGGALLLFTSYRQLNQAREALQPVCTHLGINLYAQGQTSNARLQQAFNQDVDSILLATYSFWEGVDSPGDTLRLLVIFKLPFSVPTEPLRLAKEQLLQSQGRNAFAELSLPEAVIRLKQGFGRLMRRSDDGGMVLVLDPRLVRKPYGRDFLDSLPPARRVVDDWKGVREAAVRHFERL